MGARSVKPEDLIGAWKLVSCEHLFEDGSVERPFGRAPSGRLVYGSDGGMIVLITDSGRPLAASRQLFEARDPELAAMARGCVAYSGRWKIVEDELVHDVEQSLFPNWSGSAQRRRLEWDGRRLTLSTSLFAIRGRKCRAVLVWEKE